VVVLTDYLSKWVEAFAVQDITANRVGRRIVEDIFCRFGIPGSVVSDRGQPFVSKLQQRILKLLGTCPAFTSPYHPEADGLTERFNGTLVKMIQCYVDEYKHDDWDVQLPYLLLAYRTALQQSTQESPFYLMFGRDPRLPKDLLARNAGAAAEDAAPTLVPQDLGDLKQEVQLRLNAAWELARTNIRNAQAAQKTWYDKLTYLDKCGFKEGDRVWLAVPQFRKPGARTEAQTAVEKFAVKWTGPHRVISVNGPTLKLLEILSPQEVIYRQAHVRRVRHWTPRKPADSEEKPKFTEEELLDEELKWAESARRLKRKPHRPHAYGTSKELLRRGIDPDEDSDHELDPESDAEDGEDWVIERILAHRDTPTGRLFRVKWQGFAARHNSWLTREELKKAPDIVQRYELSQQRPLIPQRPRHSFDPRRPQPSRIQPPRVKKGGGGVRNESHLAETAPFHGWDYLFG